MQLSHRQIGALRRALQEPDDVVIRRGRIDISARSMAAMALQRANRERASAAIGRSPDLGYAKVSTEVSTPDSPLFLNLYRATNSCNSQVCGIASTHFMHDRV